VIFQPRLQDQRVQALRWLSAMEHLEPVRNFT
jgi:hypothetical protein